MDIFQTSVTVIHEIYAISIFIRDVVVEMKGQKENIQEIQTKLDHEFIFLEAFVSLFSDGDKLVAQNPLIPASFSRDIANILASLKKTLSQYELLAIKYGFDLSEAKINLNTTKSKDNALQKGSVASRSSFRGRLTSNWQKLRERMNPLDWALFDKNEILNLLQEYSEWTERLRQTMTLVLLVAGSIGKQTRDDIAISAVGNALGLSKAADRQIRAIHPPPDTIISLHGTISEEINLTPEFPYRTVTYYDGSGFDSSIVIVEEHRLYVPSAHTVQTKIDKALRPVEALVWLLQGTQADSTDQSNDESPFCILQCLGWIYRPGRYPLILYQIPGQATPSEKLTSLHDWLGDKSKKPSLGQRFYLAYALATTIFHIHSSGWVHKGISSRKILMFPENPSRSKHTPYLMGWTVARPTEESYKVVSMRSNDDGPALELEPNIYRHPDRYGTPTANYECNHDIYAFGVVLIEIGLWFTMSAKFAGAIAMSTARKALPPKELLRTQVLKLSTDKELQQEMGQEYAHMVQRCLKTDFEVENDDDKHTILISKFRTLVVEKMRHGTLL